MLHEVHGRPQLHLSKVEDVGSVRGHHHQHLLPHAYECEVECYEHTASIVASRELAAIREEVIKEAPDSRRSIGLLSL